MVEKKEGRKIRLCNFRSPMHNARTSDRRKIETRTRGGKSAMGETVRLRDPHNYEITSVREDDVFDASGEPRGESVNVT